MDIIRWFLIIAATALAVKCLWAVHWALGLVLALPVFVIFMNFFGFLTLPLYGYTTEARRALRRLKDIEKDIQKRTSNKQREGENICVPDADQKTP